jgi:hypothetical protein
VAVDSGTERPLDRIEHYPIDDGEGAKIRAPRELRIEFWSDGRWQPVAQVSARPAAPAGGRPMRFEFPLLRTTKVRILLTHAPGMASALSEIMAWGPAAGVYAAPPPPAGNIAFNPDPATAYPKAAASFSDRFGGHPEKAIDGRIIFPSNPMNRWTSYGSPNPESDWLELDFGRPRRMGRVVLHVFDDSGGVRAPKSITLETWNGHAWQSVPGVHATPPQPKGGMANSLSFQPVEAAKLRATFHHIGHGDSRSGVTEIEVWAE